MHILNKLCAITRSEIFLCFFFMLSAHATSVTLPYTFTAGSPISASQMMGNFASITSAMSSTVSSPWMTSSSNIYFNTGSVGIGSSAPTHALDVTGSMSVSGAMTVNGAASFSAPISQSYTSFNNSAFQYEQTASQNLPDNTSMYFSGPTKGGTFFLVFVIGANGSSVVMGFLNLAAYVPTPLTIIGGMGNYVQSCTWNGSQIVFSTRNLPGGGGGGWVSYVRYIPLA